MHPNLGQVLDLLDVVGVRLGVEDGIGTLLLAHLESSIVDVNGHHVEAHGLGILRANLTETTGANDGEPLSRLHVATVKGMECCEAGTEEHTARLQIEIGR